MVFDLVGGGNLDPGTATHMHSLHIRFVDADHVHTKWQLFRDGKAAEKYEFNLIRKK
jgi:hypothetical protein